MTLNLFNLRLNLLSDISFLLFESEDYALLVVNFLNELFFNFILFLNQAGDYMFHLPHPCILLSLGECSKPLLLGSDSS